jgi:hypothetical protein
MDETETLDNNIPCGEVNMPTDFQVAKLTPDDLDSCYDLYSISNLIMPEGFNEPIMKAESTYDMQEFVEILQDEKTAGIVCNSREPFQENYNGGYRKEIIYISVFRGFLVYEHLNNYNGSHYSIMFCEAEGNRAEVYKSLLGVMKNRLNNSKKCSKLLWEIPEDRIELIKAAYANHFTKKEMVRSRKIGTPDTFIFEFAKTRPLEVDPEPNLEDSEPA